MAQIQILPGYGADVKTAVEQVWNLTKAEEGCESFIYNIKKDDPSVIIMYEVFKSQQAFDAHRNSDNTKIFIAKLKDKVTGDGPSLTFLTQLLK